MPNKKRKRYFEHKEEGSYIYFDGDSVWAYNPETGETELKEVLNVWVKETDEILHVSTSDGETIDTTTNHPFYVEEKGWVAAGDLEVGDILYTADGDEVEVTDLELEKLAEPITVYNLEVEDCGADSIK